MLGVRNFLAMCKHGLNSQNFCELTSSKHLITVCHNYQRIDIHVQETFFMNLYVIDDVKLLTTLLFISCKCYLERKDCD